MKFPSRGGKWRYGIGLGCLRQLLAEYGDDVYILPFTDGLLMVGTTDGLPSGWWVPLAEVDLRTETVRPFPAELIADCRAKSVGDAEAVLHGEAR